MVDQNLLSQLAGQITGDADRSQFPALAMRRVKIVSLDGGTPPTCTVQVGGDASTDIAGIKYVGGIAAGDYAMALASDTDFLVLGYEEAGGGAPSGIVVFSQPDYILNISTVTSAPFFFYETVVVSKFYLSLATAPSASTTTFSIYKNGSGSALTTISCTTSQTHQPTTGPWTFINGDYIQGKFTAVDSGGSVRDADVQMVI